jgi:hypothetical protein
MLGEIGRRQLRQALIAAMDSAASDPETRSELIYALGGVADGDPEVAVRLVEEVLRGASDFAAGPDRQHAECVAHALIVLRRSRLDDGALRARLIADLEAAAVGQGLEAMDDFLARAGEVPRVAAFARAATAEIKARARA